MKSKKGKDRKRIGSTKKAMLALLLKQLLITTSVVGYVALLSILPNAPMALAAIKKALNQERREKRKLYPSEQRRLFEQMRRERLIEVKEIDGELQVVLRRAGALIAITNNLDQLKFEQPKCWDGIWRIVIFDIPEKYKRERDAFSQKLRELHFYRLQKSTFVFPYSPQDLIDFLAEVFQISPYVRLIEAVKIDGEEEILAHFKLAR